MTVIFRLVALQEFLSPNLASDLSDVAAFFFHMKKTIIYLSSLVICRCYTCGKSCTTVENSPHFLEIEV